MFGNFTHNSPSRAQNATSPPTVERHREAFSGSPARSLPHSQITPDIIKAEEPPLVTVTSDLPEYGGDPIPRAAPKPVPSPGPRRGAGADATTTPGHARLEVVLNVSPYKPLPGQALWAEADLNQDELGTTNILSSRKRKAASPTQTKAAATAASASILHTNKLASPTPVTGKRPRGRPKGWRPGMPSTKTGLPTASAFRYLDKDGNRILPPLTSSAVGGPKTTGPKRRGRPPRAPSPTPREVWERLEPPQYVPFMCEWRGCKAELQNMETLRRHVRKLHGLGGNDGLVCQWGGCGRQQPGQEQLFTREEFHEHMEARHLVPFVWYVGDGVRNEKLLIGEQPTKKEEDDEKIPAYLLGPDGKQITPWVKGQEEEDFLTWRENRNRLKQFLLQRDQNAPFEEGDEEEGIGIPVPA